MNEFIVRVIINKHIECVYASTIQRYAVRYFFIVVNCLK